MSKVIGITPGPVKVEIKDFSPVNEGAIGDVLTRAEDGTYEWVDLQSLLDRINNSGE